MRSFFTLSFLLALCLALPGGATLAAAEGGGIERNSGGDTPVNISGIIGSFNEEAGSTRRNKGKG
ncbi:MAG: hypothetical protein CMJ94_04280 [Planctomycetes bacterium]|nr:hypothetical protein [Planctomycetota bacterium]